MAREPFLHVIDADWGIRVGVSTIMTGAGTTRTYDPGEGRSLYWPSGEGLTWVDNLESRYLVGPSGTWEGQS